MNRSSYPVPQMDLKKRELVLFFFANVHLLVFANGQLCLLRPSVISRCGIKNGSLVESCGSSATPMNRIFCGIVGVCVFVDRVLVFLQYPAVLPQHLKNILCVFLHWSSVQLLTHVAFLGLRFLAYFSSCSCF